MTDSDDLARQVLDCLRQYGCASYEAGVASGAVILDREAGDDPDTVMLLFAQRYPERALDDEAMRAIVAAYVQTLRAAGFAADGRGLSITVRRLGGIWG